MIGGQPIAFPQDRPQFTPRYPHRAISSITIKSWKASHSVLIRLDMEIPSAGIFAGSLIFDMYSTGGGNIPAATKPILACRSFACLLIDTGMVDTSLGMEP